MNNLKGFIVISELANNVAGQTAAFGELSTRAMTFSKEKGFYSNAVDTAVELVSFSAKDDLDAHYVLNTATRDHILNVAQWVRDRYVAQQIPLEASRAAFISAWEAEFVTDVASLEMGVLLPGSSATYNMPEYVQWVFTDVTDSNREHTIKIWFADSAFQAQYDLYEITVIPPLDNIDVLNNPTATVGPLLAAVTPAIIIDKVSTAVGTDPATIVKTVAFTWIDPGLPSSTLTTTWTLVIWGAAGDNSDLIIAAIRDYIAANSVLNITVWQALLPDLYNETEFAFIPLWDYIASPETMLDYGLYTPTVNPADMKAIALQFTPDNYGISYNLSTHLDLNLNLTQSTYRSLATLCVAYPGNANGIVEFSQKYTDYMAIPPSSPDFVRMSLDTQNFTTMFLTLLDHALNVTPASAAPVGYSKITRGGKLYVGKEYNGALYLALTRHSYLNP